MLIHLFNGLVHGTLLIVMCSGLALIYGLRRVVNFAHGSLYMLGAYLGYSIALHSNFWVALLVAPALMALLGALLDRWGFRLLQDRDPLSVVLVTFGLLLVIEDFVQTVWGKSNLSIATPAALAFPVDLLGTQVPTYRLAVIALGAAVALGLSLWLRFSRAGLYVRAASTDPVTTAMQGVNTDALSAFVVGLGTALAGLAGVVAAPCKLPAPGVAHRDRESDVAFKQGQHLVKWLLHWADAHHRQLTGTAHRTSGGEQQRCNDDPGRAPKPETVQRHDVPPGFHVTALRTSHRGRHRPTTLRSAPATTRSSRAACCSCRC